MKHKEKRARSPRKRRTLLVASLLLMAAITAGGTLAWLMDSSAKVDNNFVVPDVTPTIVETFNNQTKSNVSIKNTVASGKHGIDVYIRVALIPTWELGSGDVAPMPASLADLNISWNLSGNGWFKDGDYYYYRTKVPPNQSTAVLINTATVKSSSAGAQAGYNMNLQILAEAIQATEDAVNAAWPSIWSNLNR